MTAAVAQEVTVRIPHDWDPRHYQMPLWRYLERGGKRAVAVWHRRAGKDSCTLNWTAKAALQRVGVYFHMLPELKHARKVVWDAIDAQGRRMIDQVFPPDIRESATENDMKIRLANGSVWQLVGSDNYDAIVGTNPVGVVFSEWALSDPRAWDFVRPILAENGGWAVFIFTPRGENHAADLYRMAKESPQWFAELLTVDNTQAISRDAVDAEREAGMPQALIEQEFFCSFEAANVGAYYASYLKDAEEQGRIGKLPPDPTLPVYTAWDLGMDDATAIWLAQVHRKEVRIIGYLEDSGAGLEHYTKTLRDFPFTYAGHFLPPDVEVRELGTGVSRKEVLFKLGLRATVVPKLSVEDGIAAVRALLPRCWFDAEKCEVGLKALRNYRVEFNEKMGTFAARPRHDWTSHAADAFRYFAIGLDRAERERSRGRRHNPPQADGSYDPRKW